MVIPVVVTIVAKLTFMPLDKPCATAVIVSPASWKVQAIAAVILFPDTSMPVAKLDVLATGTVVLPAVDVIVDFDIGVSHPVHPVIAIVEALFTVKSLNSASNAA